MMSLLNDDERVAMWLRQKKLCPLCEQEIPESDLMDWRLVNIDHIVPRAHGGSNEISNLQLAHEPCNQKKGCGCDGPCEMSVRGDEKQVHNRFKRRQNVWRNQNHRCPVCDLLIFPMESQDDAKSYFYSSKLYHLRCKDKI